MDTAELLKTLYKTVVLLLRANVSEFEIALTIQLARAGYEKIPETN